MGTVVFRLVTSDRFGAESCMYLIEFNEPILLWLLQWRFPSEQGCSSQIDFV